MTFNLTVSPDFSPNHIAGWYIFNTWVQRKMGFGVHFELYDSFVAQRKAIAEDKVDIIFANPYDAAMLVREKRFTAIATVAGEKDEVVIAASIDSPINAVEDLKPGARVIITPDPDVELIGRIMLEPADLNKENINLQEVASYPLVAKQLMQGKADVGFFLKDAYGDLSGLVRKSLKVLVTSEIHVIRHVMLVGPRFTDAEAFREALLGMQADIPQGPRVLEGLGIPGWENQTEEDTEFMIDLMSTLQG